MEDVLLHDQTETRTCGRTGYGGSVGEYRVDAECSFSGRVRVEVWSAGDTPDEQWEYWACPCCGCEHEKRIR